MRRRARGERGQASVELMLMLPLMLLVGLVLWQVHLTLTVANDAENAARTASREGGAAAAARQALEPQYRDNITPCHGGDTECGIQVAGTRVQVWVDVPIIVPGGSNLGLGFKVHGEAELPKDSPF
jgi:TadE-like protein